MKRSQLNTIVEAITDLFVVVSIFIFLIIGVILI